MASGDTADVAWLSRIVRARGEDLERSVRSFGIESLTKEEHEFVLLLLAAGSRILAAVHTAPTRAHDVGSPQRPGYVRSGGEASIGG